MASSANAGTGGAEAAGAHSVPALAELYRDHFDFVWRNLARLGVPESSLEDAAHDVFVVAHRRLPEFEGRSAITTWLFAITYHVALEHRRRSTRHRVAVPVDIVDEASPLPDDAAYAAQARQLVHWALGQLPPERRAVLVMAELEQMTAPGIAEVLGIPLNTVYSRLRLARREIEAALKRARARGSWRNRWTL